MAVTRLRRGSSTEDSTELSRKAKNHKKSEEITLTKSVTVHGQKIASVVSNSLAMTKCLKYRMDNLLTILWTISFQV